MRLAALAVTVSFFAAACGGGTGASGTGGNGSGNQGATAQAAGDHPNGSGNDGGAANSPAAQPTGPTSTEPVSVTWWHNGTGEPLRSFWQSVADEFHQMHPNVTVHVQAFQNEELHNTLLPDAFVAGNSPDLFQSWGGAEMVQWVNEGRVRALDSDNGGTISALGTVVKPWQVAGHTYGLPYRFGPSGFWYNKDVFAAAGIAPATFQAPQTLDDLFELWDRLHAAGVTPVALGGADNWPAAHWYYWAAVRTCSPQALTLATTDHDFSDPCWLQAGEYLARVANRHPFNNNWRETHAQVGADSSSGLVIQGDAAMELTGDWAPTVMADIHANETGTVATELPDNIGWFPFPAIPGAGGDASAILGGGDGFSVASDAPMEANMLLDYILSDEVQSRFAGLGYLPTRPGADSAITYPPLRDNLATLRSADHVQLWLDVALGQEFRGMNSTIENFLEEPGQSPQVIVDQIESIAGQS